MAGLIRKLWRIAAGSIAGVVILLAIAVGLVRLALVQVPEYRDRIEARAGEALGWPVEIGAMDARLGLRGPEFRFTDARVLTRDRAGTLVKAATGSMQLDLRALLRGQLRPGHVDLAGVTLRIERNPEGHWRLLGEDGPVLGEDGSGDGQAAGTLPQLAGLPAGHLRLERVEIEFEDFYRGLGPWLFLVDSLDLQLGADRLALAASVRLPEALGAELAVSLVVNGQDELGRPSDWSGGLSFGGLNLATIARASGYDLALPAGGSLDGSLSAMAEKTRVLRVAGDARLRALVLPEEALEDVEGPVGKTVRYDRVDSAFEWARAPGGWSLQLAGLEVERGARRWSSPHLVLAFERADDARRVELHADRLQLEDLWPATRWLPADWRGPLAALAAGGTVSELEVHLDLPEDAGQMPEAYASARLEEVSVAPLGRAPGVRNLSGTLAGDLFSGEAVIASRDVAWYFPGLFRAPLSLETLQAKLRWSRDEEGLRIHVPELELENPDARVSAAGELHLPGGDASPQLEIEALARGVALEAGPRYLPVGIMPELVVRWLDAALVGGHVAEAEFTFNGPTRAFPFRNDEGVFKVEFDIADGELDFEEDWPNAAALDASVRFENEGLWAEVRSARLLGVSAGPARVAIPDLAEGELAIEGSARGSLAALREFVLASELLDELVGPGLRPATFERGRGTAEVRLELPLKKLTESRARVDLQINDGSVSYGFLGAPLRDVNARLRIDNALVEAEGATATLAGFPVHSDVVVGEGGRVRIDSRGRLDAPALARVLRLPLEAWASGEGEWRGSIRFPAPGEPAPLELDFRSDLEGFRLDLPEPFRKAAPERRNLRVQARFVEADQIDAELLWHDSLRLVARFDNSGAETVLRPVPGEMAGDPSGVVFSGAVARLDLEDWLQLRLPEGLQTDGLGAAIAGGRVLIGELAGPMLHWRDVLVDLSRGADRWLVDLAGDGAKGHLEIPFEPYGDAPVQVNLERLWLDAETAAPGDTATEDAGRPPSMLHPASVPPLEIDIGDLRLGGVRVGRVSARVLHEGDGIELIGLEGMGNGYIIQAEGRSRLSAGVDESRLSVRMRSDNVGATLADMGFRRTMEARDGQFDAEVSWQGGLRSDWLAAISGQASVLIRDGRLVGVEPGAGRVFGLLSLQALPRRLALDFKDVFGEGTSFDRISGDFRLEGGNAFTENLVMRGTAADMGVVGRTGLVARDYDQTAVIAADVGRTLPVAGAVVGGPAVGAALFVLSELLRRPFQTQITYRLTGPWENPLIEKLAVGTAPGATGAPPGTPQPGPVDAPRPDVEALRGEE